MKRRTAISLCSIIAFAVVGISLTNPTYADCNGVSTVLIQCGDNESGIDTVLNLIINIFTVIIGILAVIGITIVGVQYLTAGDNVDQTRKAKRRMLEIVIGLAAYALLYTGLNWLLPGGISLNPVADSGTEISSGAGNDGESAEGNANGSSDSNRETGSEDVDNPQGIRGDGNEGWVEEE